MRPPRPSGGNAGRGVQAAWLGGGMAERPVGQTLLALVVTLAAIPLTLHLITQLFERPYAFYIDANSEVLELSTTELTGTRWYLGHARLLYQVDAAREERLPNALIPLDQETPDREPIDFLGYLEIGPNAAVTLTRKGAGPLDIQIKPAQLGDPPDATRLPGVLLEPLTCDLPMHPHASASPHPNCVDEEEPTSITVPLALREATLRVDIGESPLNGTLKGLGHIGGEPYQPTTPGSPPLMRHGEVTVVGRRLVSEQIYTLMQAPLHLGDTVSVRGETVNPPAAAKQEDSALFTCLFSVESKVLEGKGIDLACHARGRSLAIGRYGDISRNDLAPRPWDVLINEPSMQATLPLAITGLFILVMRLLDGLYPRLCQKLSAGLARLQKRRT